LCLCGQFLVKKRPAFCKNENEDIKHNIVTVLTELASTAEPAVLSASSSLTADFTTTPFSPLPDIDYDDGGARNLNLVPQLATSGPTATDPRIQLVIE